MKNLEEIKKNIISADIKIIADVTGYSTNYIFQILNPENPRSNARVLELCEHAIECRKEAKEKIKQLNQQLLTSFNNG